MTTIASSSSSNSPYSGVLSKLYNGLDSNGDGSLSEGEFSDATSSFMSADQAANVFSMMNTSGSGSVSEVEFDNYVTGGSAVSGSSAQAMSYVSAMMLDRQMPQTSGGGSQGNPDGAQNSASNLFASMDTDGDGKVSEAEFLAAKPNGVTDDQAKALYSSIDTSGKGAITEDQFAAGMKSNDAAQGSKVHGGHHHHHGGGGGAEAAAGIFKQMDTDSSGSVTEAEFLALKPDDVSDAQAKALFGSIDTSGSGSITEDQFANFLSQGAGAGSTAQSAASPTGSNASTSNGTQDDVLSQLMDLIQNAGSNYDTNSIQNSALDAA